MAEAITFEFPVSGSGKKLSGKNMGIDLRNHIIKVEDDGTAYRNFSGWWHNGFRKNCIHQWNQATGGLKFKKCCLV